MNTTSTKHAAISTVPHARRPVVRALSVVGAMLAIEAVMIGLAVGWVAYYSYVVDPGHSVGHYEAYAQRASPRVALIVSMPVFALLGLICSRRAKDAGARFALHATYLVIAIDLAMVALVAGAEAGAWGICVVAVTLKLAGVLVGNRFGTHQARALV